MRALLLLLGLLLMAASASAAPGQIVIPVARYSGKAALPGTPVIGTPTSLRVSLDVSDNTDPTVAWVITVEYSTDGGSTWQPAGNCARNGFAGPVTDKNGQVVTTSGCAFSFPNGANRLRGTLQILGGALSTLGRIEWE
jgi:hypothetical protein